MGVGVGWGRSNVLQGAMAFAPLCISLDVYCLFSCIIYRGDPNFTGAQTMSFSTDTMRQNFLILCYAVQFIQTKFIQGGDSVAGGRRPLNMKVLAKRATFPSFFRVLL